MKGFVIGLVLMIGVPLLIAIAKYILLKERLALAASGKQSPTALPHAARDVSTTAVTTAVAVIDPFNFSLPLRREVFTGVLTAGREYDITISGVVQDCFVAYDRLVSVDAFYHDYYGNFTKAYHSLCIDTETVPHADLTSTDRELHRYTLRLLGEGKKLAFCFAPSLPREFQASQHHQGSLYVNIQETAASMEARATAEAQERAMEGKAEAERQVRIEELIADQRHRPHRADPAYQEKYAAKHKDKLLDDRDEIIQENLDFENNVIPVLKEQGRDDLIPFGEWEVKALAIAERLDVEPPPAPAPRRKLTNEELKADTERYRQRKHIWNQAKVEDARQNVEDFLRNDRFNWQLEQEYVAELRGRGMDEDDIQQRLPEFRAALSQPEDGGNGQGFKRL